MGNKMIRADKKTRIIYLILILILVLLAISLYVYWQSYYSRLTILAEQHPDQALMKIVSILKLFILINPIITLGFIIYFISLGTKTYKSNQFPPPGIKVIRDIRLTEGNKAKKYAIGLWLFAVALMIFAIVITVLLNNFINNVY
jgi:hypothetical protein